MAWIESHQELREHPKTKRFRKLLVVSVPQAVGHLHCLWWWALSYAEDGYLSNFDASEIAEAAMWEGDPEPFVAALRSSGFLDEDSRIHDWEDYAYKYVLKRQANAERMRLTRAAHMQRTSDARAGATVEDSTVEDSTVPNQNNKPEMVEEKKGKKTSPFKAPDGATSKSVFAALCELTGEDAANATKRNLEKATRAANDMLRKGHTQDQILGCYRWIVSDPWWLDKADMATIAGKIDRWIALGEPTEQQGRGNGSTGKRNPAYGPGGNAGRGVGSGSGTGKAPDRYAYDRKLMGS